MARRSCSTSRSSVFGVALESRQLVPAVLDLRLQARERLAPAIPGLGEALDLSRPGGFDAIQALRLVGNAFGQQFQMGHVVPYRVDAFGTGLAEVAVIGQHPAELGRILLVEQQLQAFVPTVQVGHFELAGEGFTLLLHLPFGVRLFGAKLPQPALRRLAFCTRRGKPLLRGLDADLGVLELDGHGVAALHVLVDGLADGTDLAADLAQFRLGGLGGRGRRQRSAERGTKQQAPQDRPGSLHAPCGDSRGQRLVWKHWPCGDGHPARRLQAALDSPQTPQSTGWRGLLYCLSLPPTTTADRL